MRAHKISENGVSLGTIAKKTVTPAKWARSDIVLQQFSNFEVQFRISTFYFPLTSGQISVDTALQWPSLAVFCGCNEHQKSKAGCGVRRNR